MGATTLGNVARTGGDEGVGNEVVESTEMIFPAAMRVLGLEAPGVGIAMSPACVGIPAATASGTVTA